MQDRKKKLIFIFVQNFYIPNSLIWIKVLCNDIILCQINKPCPHQKQLAEKQDFKKQNFYSTTESQLMQNALYRTPQKDILIY